MKHLSLLMFALVCSLAFAQAQCVIDSSIIATGQIVKPYPSTPSNPNSTLKPACAGQPYSQSITFNIPDTITIPQFPVPVALNSVTIKPTGAISGLPNGIGYSCNPPNCVFPKNSLGCILLSGVTNDPPGNDTLSITMDVATALFPFPIALKFPDQLSDTLVYYIVVKPAGQCNSSTIDLNSQISSLKTVPNPFAQQTSIVIEARQDGNYRFEVFDLYGKALYSEKLRLIEGENRYTFDAGDLPNGVYFYSISNELGRASNRFVIAR